MENKKLDIYWCRHDYSCANFLKSIGLYGPKDALKNFGIKDARGKYATNSSLTNLINFQKLNHPTRKLKFDLIIASELRRSIQTAYHLKPNNEIYPIPFIGEVRHFSRLDTDNSPDPILYMKKTYQHEKYFQKTNYNLYAQITDNLGDKIKKGVSNSNYEFFLKYCLPEILEKLMKNNPNKKSYQILIISHQNFISKLINSLIKNEFNNKKYKIPNLGVFKQSLELSTTGTILKEDKIKLVYPKEWDSSISITIPNENENTKIEMNPNLPEYKNIKLLDSSIIDYLITPCETNLKNYVNKYIKMKSKKKSQTKLKVSVSKKVSTKKNAKYNWTKRKTS